MDEDLSRKIIVIGAGNGARTSKSLAAQLLGRCTREIPVPVTTVNVGTIGHIDYGVVAERIAAQGGILSADVPSDPWPASTSQEVMDELRSALTSACEGNNCKVEIDVIIIDDDIKRYATVATRYRDKDMPAEGVAAPRRNVPQGKGKSRLDKQNRWK